MNTLIHGGDNQNADDDDDDDDGAALFSQGSQGGHDVCIFCQATGLQADNVSVSVLLLDSHWEHTY